MGLDVGGHPPKKRAPALAGKIASLRKRLSITTRLSDMGVSLSDIPQLASYALGDPCLATNPRLAGLGDIETIYREIRQ